MKKEKVMRQGNTWTYFYTIMCNPWLDDIKTKKKTLLCVIINSLPPVWTSLPFSSVSNCSL